MNNINIEKVISVHHWNEKLFSFQTTRNKSFRFINGHFVMIGLIYNNKPLMRAYSIASANYEDYLEFLSIKVPNGLLTSKLKQLKVGDEIIVNNKSVGTLVIDNLKPGNRLFLFATGTGLAPFLSIIKDYRTYDSFEKIVLVHSVRSINELAYKSMIEEQLPNNDLIGKDVKEKLIYYPTVTQQDFYNNYRITNLIKSDNFFNVIKIPKINYKTDRAMICGSPQALNDISKILDDLGFKASSNTNGIGDYVIERAFVNN
ncbi:ferredoxin--NADP+ reductase [Candidatus Kinetoplastibacterium blastocrithidii TCC012E]|uniref:ferredoxin--NADP(+) reductase n=1 Tax=Candidatus Kinetoplastidibacterium blastocrithidiae TCC012E TaxID=1208922 RepID=M1LW77_9PROT|nr:ferredoxin--NADP reductase [Candidatus Kinetoplastibacterium blastocrithidii]AFZ83660.1 ferredoxin--NADP reductase [Candidatus Kinetoplastibacterium blastocrithidii (ex Strigomonas culicis)]AGF49782.1 ferredoxin--NADP+ reductase [Candidatus Kinetoplastibacterium blastocrithidii TCC012E]